MTKFELFWLPLSMDQVYYSGKVLACQNETARQIEGKNEITEKFVQVTKSYTTVFDGYRIKKIPSKYIFYSSVAVKHIILGYFYKKRMQNFEKFGKL